jgi:hypothetical protein
MESQLLDVPIASDNRTTDRRSIKNRRRGVFGGAALPTVIGHRERGDWVDEEREKWWSSLLCPVLSV